MACGAAASGEYRWAFLTPGTTLAEGGEDLLNALGCMLLSGRLLTGYTQTMNDWYDRDLDAINEPYRPIPSGRITEQVIQQILFLLGLGLPRHLGGPRRAGGPAALHHPQRPLLPLLGAAIQAQTEGWRGCFALGSSYIALPWWCGRAMFGELTLPVVGLTSLYSFAGLGVAIVNDAFLDLILPQVAAQLAFFLKDSVANDVKYQAAAQPFLVLGLLVTALAVGHHGGAV